MPENEPRYCSWFENTDTVFQTTDGEEVKVVNFNHEIDEVILNEWANHFRKHYCSDHDLTEDSTAMGVSRADYLRDIKFPGDGRPGSSIRAGDFAEILVADYIQFLMGFSVPRTRYDRKVNRNSSTQSVDIFGFKFNEEGNVAQDELITCEVKAHFTNSRSTLQNAIDDSKKDFEMRLPFALNASRQRLRDRNELDTAEQVGRFMNKLENPYREISGAALVCSNAVWEEGFVTGSTSEHSNDNVVLLTFLGDDFMELVHRLYEIAYVTA